MREFPIKKFWYGKGAAYKSIEDLIENNPDWFLWALETFQDLSPEQAAFVEKLYGEKVPDRFICSQELMDEINNGEPYEWKKGDGEEVYKEICRKYANATYQEWNSWLKSGLESEL